jgi:hypothetical protein
LRPFAETLDVAMPQSRFSHNRGQGRDTAGPCLHRPREIDMKRSLPALLGCCALSCVLSACAVPVPADGGSAGGTPVAACDATHVAWAVGQVADDALVEKARVESGSTSVRVLRPGMVITREFNGARLNIRVDNEHKVLSVSCG